MFDQKDLPIALKDHIRLIQSIGYFVEELQIISPHRYFFRQTRRNNTRLVCYMAEHKKLVIIHYPVIELKLKHPDRILVQHKVSDLNCTAVYDIVQNKLFPLPLNFVTKKYSCEYSSDGEHLFRIKKGTGTHQIDLLSL